MHIEKIRCKACFNFEGLDTVSTGYLGHVGLGAAAPKYGGPTWTLFNHHMAVSRLFWCMKTVRPRAVPEPKIKNEIGHEMPKI